MTGLPRMLCLFMTVLDPRPRPADELSALLERFQWSVIEYRKLTLGRRESRRFADAGPRFHFVASGTGEFRGIAADKPLRAGDFLLLPRGGDYELVPHEDTVLQTGTLELDSPAAGDLLARLPDFVLACSFVAKEPFIAALLEGMSTEACTDRPGSASVVSKLANVVATAAIRTWIESGCGASGLLTLAVRDADVNRAVAAIHREPGQPWTVESLARLALSSRSTFVERFREVTGEPPARYVARVRMEEAKRMLQEPYASVSQVAVTLGYGSDAAFSRAFRRFAGSPPTEWRRADRVSAG